MGAESSRWQTGPGFSWRSGGEFIKYCCLNSAGVRSMNLVTPKTLSSWPSLFISATSSRFFK